MSPGIKPAPTFSYMLNFSSCKPVSAESGHSFLNLVSVSPSSLQHDFQQQSAPKSSSGSCYPANSTFCKTVTLPNWPLVQNTGSLNPSGPPPALDMCPAFPFNPTISTSNYSAHGHYNDLDSLRAVISHAGSRTENGISTMQRGLDCPPSRDADGERCNASNGNLMLEASPQAPSSTATKHTSAGSECPRVFCLSSCGDLLLSNTGFCGIRCSCHGSHMSVLNFCKHSGLSDVNPGYAVHMDTGECIAQWRKVYLQQFGIRAPDDHRGWDWPEGLLTTSSLLRSNIVVPQEGKVFDLSSLFTSSAESIKSSQPRNNVFPSNLQLSQDCANKMSKTEQLRNGCYQQHLLTGHPTRNSHRMMNNPLIPCGDPSSSKASRVGVGGSRNDCQLSSGHSKIISISENLFSFPYQNVQSTGSKMHDNLKDKNVLQKGGLLSSTELKLGLPSQQGWCVGSTTVSAMRSNIRDLQTTPVQEQLDNILGNSKVIDQGNQRLHFHPAFDLRETKEQSQPDLLNNAPSSANATFSLEHSRGWLYSISENSVPVPSSNTSAGGSSVHHKANNKGINESHRYSPWKLHSQSDVDKCRLMDFTCTGGDGPIRPLGIKELALQKKENSTPIPRPGHSTNVGSESSFKLYVQQMENSGFCMKGVKLSHPNSCTVPDEKVNSLGMAGMLPGAYFPSNHIGNVRSLGSIPDPGHVTSSLGFGATKTMHARSLGSTPLTVAQESGHDSASLHRDVHAVNSHRSDESWRVLTLGSTDQGSMGLNRRPRIHPDQREHTKNCCVSDVGVGSSFLDPGPSKGRHDHFLNIQDDTTQTILPDIGGDRACNVGHGTTMEGNNNWDGLRVFMRRMPFNSEMTDKYEQGPCNPQPKKLPSLKGGNKVSGCMLPRHCEGSSTHISGRCCCTAPSICSNTDWYSKDTSAKNCLEKQVNIAVVEAPKFDGSRLSDSSTAFEKAVIVECNQQMKEQIVGKLDCMDSQWKDVPPKATPFFELRSLDVLGKLSGKNGEVESHLKEVGADGISSDKVAELQGNELSNISSGSSAPAVTQASNEVDNIGSCTVDASNTGKWNDQIVDQGSVIDISCSSVDAIDSVKSSQHACCGKATSSGEESPEKLPNVASHGRTDEFKLRHLESKELQNSGDSVSSYGKVTNKMQKNENKSTPRKRKDGIKWKTLGPTLDVSHVSLLPSGSPLQTRNASENHAHASEDVHIRHQFNQDSSSILDANIKISSFKRKRSALSSIKMLSRKRDLNGMYNISESESDDERPVRGRGNSVVMPENIAVKRLRLVEAAVSVMKPVKAAKQVCFRNLESDENLNCSLQCQQPVVVSHENICNQKAKPIACGKYGIICNRELDLDQLKPPKIVSLTQVLRSSRKCSKFADEHALASVRNMVHFSDSRKFIHGCSTHSSGQVRKLISCEVGFCETSAQTLQTYHKEDVISANDCSALGQVGVDGSKRNPSFTSCHPSAQSKPKEVRVRSLYELSMKGKDYLSADFSLCQTVISAECEPERKASKGTGESDGDKCSSFARRSLEEPPCSSVVSELDALCCVCGISRNDNSNCLLECGHCFIRVHQGCYGISRVPKGDWYCRPCKTGAKNVACVLCGYGGGAMTRAFGSRGVVKSLLKAWKIRTESHIMGLVSAETLYVQAKDLGSARFQPSSLIKPVMHNSIIAGLFDRTVRQWVHMVCGLWTPGSRCPNVDTMSAFDVSDVSVPKAHMVCNICKRLGGPCIRCYVDTCSSYFHPWCAHHKRLLQRDVEGVNNHKVGFSGRCLLHANHQPNAMESDNDTDKIDSETEQEKGLKCARTEVYRGKNLEGGNHSSRRYNDKGKCLVTQVQLDAWLYINRQKLGMKRLPKLPVSDVDQDYRKEYARYKQAMGWKQLVVYKSGIHALGLYTSQFIPRGAMVVEYIGEIVGPRVADKRESEYLAGRKLQYKGACYFFRIDKEQIIDATRKGGIARFVNHSCQPNCVAKVITIRSEKKVVFFAERDIDPGEEITYDYHFNHEDEGKKIPCFCKSSNCRRYLN